MAKYNQVGYGSQGSDVTELQRLLNQNGAKLTVDGIFGNQTKNAVMEYQKNNGLDVDGIAGNNTWGSLTKESTANSTPTKNPTQSTNTQWSYDAFQPSDATVTAGQNRDDVANRRPGDFTFEDYTKSDAVLQAEALLRQHLGNKPGEYQSAWQTQIDDIMNRIMNREKFSYDLNGDALYQQYKDQYTTQGKMAMMDTMGQAQAMTGGYGNSYAQSVGQQAYQGYLQQLNDVVPELYQMALDQYNREGDELYRQYGLYTDRDNQDYGRYRDTVSDYYTDRDYYTEDARYQSETDYNRYQDRYNREYGQYRDSVADWQYDMDRADDNYWNQYDRDYAQYSDDRNLSYDNYWNDKNFTYQQGRDEVADKQWQSEFDEAKRQFDTLHGDDDDDKGSGTGGSGGGGGGNGGSGGSGGGNGGSGYDNGGLSERQIKQIQRALGITADGKWGPESQKAAGGLSAVDAYDALRKGEFDSPGRNQNTQYNGTNLGNGNGNDNGGNGNGFTGSTYSEAAAYLKSKGLSTAGLMTQSEWQRHKNGNNSAGGEHEADTYQEYLAAYIYGKMNG